jgi:hypothetical protein
VRISYMPSSAASDSISACLRWNVGDGGGEVLAHLVVGGADSKSDLVFTPGLRPF